MYARNLIEQYSSINEITVNKMNNIVNAAEGKQWYEKAIVSIGKVTNKRKYNDVKILKQDIKRCEKALEDIKNEKKHLDAVKGNAAATAVFLKRELLRLGPLVGGPTGDTARLTVGRALHNRHLAALASALSTPAATIDYYLNDTSRQIYDTKGYKALLDHYEKEITKIKKDLERKLDKLEQQKSIKESFYF